MNRFLLILIIPVLVFFATCNENRIYEERMPTTAYRWDKTDKMNFSVDIDDINSTYSIILDLRYINGFQFKYLHLNMETRTPNSRKYSKDYSVQVISENKKYRGEGIGDYWDLEEKLETKMKFKTKGKYVFSLKPKMEENQISRIMEVGIIIEKTKQE